MRCPVAWISQATIAVSATMAPRVVVWRAQCIVLIIASTTHGIIICLSGLMIHQLADRIVKSVTCYYYPRWY
jgi:hypothetical protein